jgi:hypothetical protein
MRVGSGGSDLERKRMEEAPVRTTRCDCTLARGQDIRSSIFYEGLVGLIYKYTTFLFGVK